MESVAFDVVHCSSFEPGYEPEQLILMQEDGQPEILFQDIGERNGWQTKRYPDYPQNLILQLQTGLCRITKVEILSHHYKIASQIELYAGITKDQEEDSTFIQFTRLGFVNLVNNQRCQGRELKTIQIQADAEYLRLVIKGCHENKLNVYQQVGFLALNVVGQAILTSPRQYEQVEQMAISVGFSADLDLLKHWIHVVQHAEEESAQEEDYKEAKIYKEIGDQLEHLWKLLFNLEQDKQQAVTAKDYDEADKIKADMIQVRNTAESILKHAGIQITDEGDILPYDDVQDAEQEEEENQYNNNDACNKVSNTQLASPTTESKLDQHCIDATTPPSYNTDKLTINAIDNQELMDEAIANWTSFDALSIQDINDGRAQQSSPLVLPKSHTLQQPTANNNKNNKHVASEPSNKKPKQRPAKNQNSGTISPEPLSIDDREACELPISLFGEEMVACIMSVKTKCRQKGLKELSLCIQENKEENDLSFIHATLILIQEVAMDSRESIFNQAIESWKEIFGMCQRIVIEDDEIRKVLHLWIEKFFSRVLMRTTGTNSGIQQSAVQVILDLLQLYDLSLILLCINKDRNTMIRNIKDAKARINLITVITKKVLVPLWNNKNTVLYRQELMMFITSYYKHHPNADVRKAAWKLLVIVAQHQDAEGFKHICTFVENDTVKLLQQEIKQEKKKKSLLSSSNSATVQGLKSSNNKFGHNDTAVAKKSVKQTKPNSKWLFFLRRVLSKRKIINCNCA
ncbi:MAG: hypothetical protein EXX96DRAFT_326401 [Benjaminiella poitrasii]|nr:MAG: hypothetical protein EXX96DRAFT_326401 [Benjaminiella poitrasii]